jgi:hypothetical protein
MEIPEFIIKMIQIGALCIAVVVLIAHSISFVGNLETYDNQKAAIDFSQAVLSDPCIIKDLDGNIRKGMFDYYKLIETDELCVKIDGTYYVKIEVKRENRLDEWEFGDRTIEDGEKVKVPLILYYADNIIYPGHAEVTVKTR